MIKFFYDFVKVEFPLSPWLKWYAICGHYNDFYKESQQEQQQQQSNIKTPRALRARG